MLPYAVFGAALMGAAAVGAKLGGDQNPVRVTDNRVDKSVKIDNRRTLFYSNGNLIVDGQLEQPDSPEPQKIKQGPTITEIDETPHLGTDSYHDYVKKLLPSATYLKKDTLGVPLKVTGIGVASITTLYVLRKITRWFIQQHNLWCNWRRDIPTNKLYTTEDIAQTLIAEIQNKYTTTHNAYDFIEPLQLFLETIDTEINNLTWYYSLTSGLHSVYIGKLFGINECSLNHAKDSLERAQILKKIFINWTAELKFGKQQQL